MKIDWFLVSLFCAVVLSFIFPQIGANGGPLHLEYVTKWGVFMIFFLHGAKLSFDQIKLGIGAWRLHLVSQSIVFIILPIIGSIIYFASGSLLNEGQRLGILFLCAISSTISSSIILTAMARGNISGAVFSATISGILGIFITPILIASVYAGAGKIDAFSAIIEIMKLIFMPFVLGQCARPIIGKLLERHKSFVANIDRIIIVLIVFAAFCNSNKAQIFTQITPISLVTIAAIISALLFAAIFITKAASKIIGLSRDDNIAAIFVGATKSLANGISIAGVLFAKDPQIGIIILPLMLYHPLQLGVCAWLARRWSANAH